MGIQIADAARQAALYASDNPAFTNQQLILIGEQNAGSGLLGCPSPHVAVDPTTPYLGKSYYQPVTVTCSLPMITPFIPSPAHISATAEVLVVPSP